MELAESAALLREDSPSEQSRKLAAQAEELATETLEMAAENGCDLTNLRATESLSFLQHSGVWDRLNVRTSAPVP